MQYHTHLSTDYHSLPGNTTTFLRFSLRRGEMVNQICNANEIPFHTIIENECFIQKEEAAIRISSAMPFHPNVETAIMI